MIKIAPSILSADFARLHDEIQDVEQGGADILHIDVMDGHFVPNLTIGPPVLRSITKYTSLPIDVHLMITNPNDFIDEFADSGANYLTVHVEVCHHLHRTVSEIRKRGMKAGVSLNPATSLHCLDAILDEIDMVLVMSVNPGFGGQTFIPSSLQKIRSLANMLKERKRSDVEIEVDGGASPSNIRDLAEAGVTIAVAGSSVFNAPDRGKIIQEMKAACA
ncbi:ribulose-phosphate 3-epimerase [candidate division KSB3 bacterium]|uniref:Ribulose-phosphate 3-epimerase n=1 Tax=candidate division KSB3 bacterium TaxID=2044937 RepID=A0A2G6E249_9BACT|nr:MAG: ribulose-phosphate 3-epimerase [candidate division KSB3 bacterium]PIE28767.1 MAG: ribulose-phosphate 3-epimerase [candidate division KSB3 bacterium]